jgi:hypothetical protein
MRAMVLKAPRELQFADLDLPVVGLSELESAIHMLDSDADERMKIILDHAN